MAHKYQYTCEGTIRLKRDGEDFATFVYIETNLMKLLFKKLLSFFQKCFLDMQHVMLLIVVILKLDSKLLLFDKRIKLKV